MARLALVALLLVAAFAQEPPRQRYLISIDAESTTISSGKVWLYSYTPDLFK